MFTRRSLLIAAAPVSLGGCAARPVPVTLTGTLQVEHTARDGLRRRLLVAAPAGTPPPGGWPVLYVLDGNALFPSASLLVRNLAQRANFQNAVVVGIGYPGDQLFDENARAFDYTPPAPSLRAGGRYGGAERFLDFIAQELQPLVQKEFGANVKRQALFGHSFAGLLVLHSMFTRSGLFHTHIAASPSVWWEQQYVLSGLQPFVSRAARGDVDTRLLLTVGSLEQTPPEGMPADRAAALRARRQVDGVRELAARLEGVRGVQVALREMPGEVHGTSSLPALQRTVEFTLGPLPGGGSRL